MAVASLLSKVVRKKRTLKDRTREVKGKTKSKRFEEIKKKADEADKKKADKADKKAGSPKMAAEKKAARPARGDAKDAKKLDTPRIKELEKVKKSIGQDQIGKINRLFSQKAEGNFKGKQQMALASTLQRDLTLRQTRLKIYMIQLNQVNIHNNNIETL